MTRKAPLRAVSEGEKPTPKRPTSVSQAVSEGSARDELVAMRARIARAIDDPDIRGADLAALSRRLMEIGKELSAIDARREQEEAESADEAQDGAFDRSAI